MAELDDAPGDQRRLQRARRRTHAGANTEHQRRVLQAGDGGQHPAGGSRPEQGRVDKLLGAELQRESDR